MIMTDAGLAAIEASSRGPLSRVMSWLGLTQRVELAPFSDSLYSFDAQPAYTGTPAAAPAQREPRRLAENFAFQAMVAARHGKYSDAESFFREAFTIDRALSPESLTSFWELSRQGHEAANRALIAAGRDDDAVQLAREISDRDAASEALLVRAAS